MNRPPTVYDVLAHSWQKRTQRSRRRIIVALLLLGVVWMIGAVVAPTVVAGIDRLSGIARLLMALCMGAFSLPWWALKSAGYLPDTTQTPHLLWIPLAFTMPTVLYGLAQLLGRPANSAWASRIRNEQLARSQGRLSTQALIAQLRFRRGIPLARITDESDASTVTVGLDETTSEGHVLVIAPTRSGKGLHLTDTLLSWRGPVIIADPKAEQFERTAVYRRQFGPVYRFPGHRIRLADYYTQLLDNDDMVELYNYWIRPIEGREKVFGRKSLSLFSAVGHFAKAHQLDPIRLLFDLVESNPQEAFAALEQHPAAKRHVRVFTNGAAPDAFGDDRFVTSALGTLALALKRYQKHLDTIAPIDERHLLPHDWAQQNGTIYLTYPLEELAGAGGVVASIIGALLRDRMRRPNRQPTRQRMLIAIDELPALALSNLNTYLATAGGYGVMLLLYAQSIGQLHALYDRNGTQAILSNCVHQLWYPPADPDTAAMMSKLYGQTLRPMPAYSTSTGTRQQHTYGVERQMTNHNHGASWSWQTQPELLPSQMLGLQKGQVLVSTLQQQRAVFLGRRISSIPLFAKLPSGKHLQLPKPPAPHPTRAYTDWKAYGGTVVSSNEATPPSTNPPESSQAQRSSHSYSAGDLV